MFSTPAQQTLLALYVKKILAAPVYELAIRTPLQPAPALSLALGNQILLKREDLQPTFSFKIRGAYNKLVNFTAAQKKCGVITASAGNHAQGVALAARELGIDATIVLRGRFDCRHCRVRQIPAAGGAHHWHRVGTLRLLAYCFTGR